jgi:hypothetical protein
MKRVLYSWWYWFIVLVLVNIPILPDMLRASIFAAAAIVSVGYSIKQFAAGLGDAFLRIEPRPFYDFTPDEFRYIIMAADDDDLVEWGEVDKE